MNMLTQFLKQINWVDIGLVVLFLRIVFISIKNGFVTEFLKFFGVICALFISLHYYASLAQWAAQKTTLPLVSWRFLIFAGLCAGVVFLFKFITQGLLLLFKVETNHQGFDKYAAGFLGAGRAIFVSSLVIFGLLLMPHPAVHHQAASSAVYRIAGRAAPNTYAFLHHNLISKFFEQEKLNADVFEVVASHGVDPK
jgi:uncharacterized membrane protein required for colicin V production